MKTIMSVGVAVISSFLLICHFCTFVSCALICEEGCTRDDKQRTCICLGREAGQPEKKFPITNQRTKRSTCEHHTTQCTSTGDPHITTFHGNYYHIYQDRNGKVGVYTLVKLDSRSLWIQAKHDPCWGVACNCGVMAREGNSIIGVTKCNRDYPLLIEYQLKEGAPSGSIRTISGGWKISLLSGIEIDAIHNGKYMDLYVRGLKNEVNWYEGLCSANNVGYNSVCKGNECEAHRVSYKNSFFSITQSNLPKTCDYSDFSKCFCPRNYPNCDDPWGDYLLKTDIKRVCRGYRKRDMNKNDKENDVSKDKDYIDPNDLNNDQIETEVKDRELNLDYRFFDDVRALNPGSKLSVEDGRRRCNEALGFSRTFELCSARVDTSAIVEKCALDVDIMEDYGPSTFVPTQLETACLDNIRLSLESVTASDISLQELKDLLSRVEKLVCPLQCSQNGRCVDSKCQCNEGFMGTDCSLRTGQVPAVHRIIMPVCDIRRHPCTQIHVETSDLTNPENVVCKMRTVNDLDGAVPAVQTSTPEVAGGMALCKLPQMPVSVKESNNGKSTTSFLVQVSISNDGQTYSKELPFTVLDGNCMECPASQKTPCQLKENTCSIGGRCYKAGKNCPQDEAKTCNPAKCTTKWTSESSTNCDDGFVNCA